MGFLHLRPSRLPRYSGRRRNTRGIIVPLSRTLVPSLLLALTAVAFAQTKPELLLYHPSAPLPSYEVATIKPIDPATAAYMVRLPPGVTLSPLSIRRYIMDAYGAIYPAQIVGGPAWLDKDAYNIKGKPSDDLEAAMQKMTFDDRNVQTRSMQQSLLADR